MIELAGVVTRQPVGGFSCCLGVERMLGAWATGREQMVFWKLVYAGCS